VARFVAAIALPIGFPTKGVFRADIALADVRLVRHQLCRVVPSGSPGKAPHANCRTRLLQPN
jgi:hypothetical protein